MSDYDTIQRRRNIIVGAFVVVALCAFMGLIWVFGDLPIAVSKIRSFNIIVQFATAPGVERNTPVRLAGYQVGRVIAVMAPEVLEDLKTGQRYHQTKVVIAIDKQYVNIPSNAEILLMKRGFGSSYIEIEVDPKLPLTPLDPNNPKTAYLQAGMLIQGGTGTVSEFFSEQTQEKLEKLIENLSVLVKNTNVIVGDEQNQRNFREILTKLSQATEEATKTLIEIRKFSTAGTQSIEDVDIQITKFTTSIAETTDELNVTLKELRTTFEKVNSGDGTAAKLLNDGRLYENLLDSSQELRAAIAQLKLLIADARQKGLKLKL